MIAESWSNNNGWKKGWLLRNERLKYVRNGTYLISELIISSFLSVWQTQKYKPLLPKLTLIHSRVHET